MLKRCCHRLIQFGNGSHAGGYPGHEAGHELEGVPVTEGPSAAIPCQVGAPDITDQ